MANSKSTSTARVRAARSNSRRSNANNISNNRDKRFMTLVVLLAVALIGSIGVAVAAISQQLTISGTATVKATNWDVHFDNLKAATPISSANTAKEKTAPTLDTAKTTISTYDVELRNPGDAIYYDFDVVNGGDIDAKIDTIVKRDGGASTGSTALTCTSTKGDSTAQATRNAATCANLSYTLSYIDETPVAAGDVLAAGATKTMRLKLEYKAPTGGATAYYPDDDVAVSDLGVTVTYVQSN